MKNRFTRLTALVCAAAILLCSLPMQALAAEFQPQTTYEDSLPDGLPVQDEPAVPEDPESSEESERPEQPEPAADASAEPEAAPEEPAAAVLSTGNKSGDFTYSVLSDNTAQITGYSGTAANLIVPDKLDGYTVTRIGGSAFRGSSALSAVKLPDSVTYIDGSAFADCTNLSSVNYPMSLNYVGQNAFKNCNKITTFVIPEGVTKVPDNMFWRMEGLRSVSLPSTLTEIGDCAFYQCTGLTAIELPKELTRLYGAAFLGCTGLTSIELPDSVTRIDGSAFADCTNLSSVNYPMSLNYVGQNAFKNCNKITTFVIPEGITKVPDNMFWKMEGLRTVSLPSTLTEIGDCAFYQCTGLTAIELPKGLTRLYGAAFLGCISLTSIELPDSVTRIDGSAFADCTNLVSINYPMSLNYIGLNAFKNCNKITSFVIPEGITKVPDYMFWKMEGLRTVSLPSTLTEIGECAFYECTGLTRIVLPVSVERINGAAFAGCTELQQVAFLGTRCSFGGSVFRNSENVSFYCPMASEEALYAIENDIPIMPTGGIQDDPKSVLEHSGCSYFAELGSMAANGLVSVTVRYAVKDSVKAAVTNKSLRLYLPRTAELYEQTLKLDGVLCTEYTYDGERVLTIPVEKDSGTLKFSLHVTAQGNLFSYAVLVRTKDGASGKDIIGILNDSVNVLTLNAPDTATTASVTVSGLAPASAEVKLSVNGSAQQAVTASKAGSWSGTVTFPSPEDYHSYTILAECQSGDSLMQQSASVTYHAEEPTVTDFKMYYNEHSITRSCDLLHAGAIRPKVYFLPGTEFRFELKIDHPEQINTLYVTSTRSNEVKYLQATYDEERGLFTTNGYFDENDHRYVPGTISYEYTKKITPVTVDTSYDWSVFDPQLPSDKKDAIRFSQYTDSNCTAQIDLGSVYSGLNEVVVDAAVSVYDELTDGDLKDWLGVFKDFDKMDSYLVPGKDGEKFYVTMDASDPFSYVMLVRDIAGSKFVKFILKEKLDNTQNLDTVWSLVKISSALSAVSTVTNVMYKQHSIEKDMDKLREEVLQTSYGTPQQRQEALRQVDALEHDQSAFMLLTTILPLVVAGAPIALGATMSAAPAILFTAMLGVLTSVAPMFWELRTAQIKGQKFRVDFVVDPSGYVYDQETNERLEGVKTTAYYIPEPANATEEFWKNTPAANTYGELWNGAEYDQSNPLYTNADGKYAWNVPTGWWRVKYEKEGYETAWSDWMTVPPERTEVNIGLKPLAPEYTVRAETVTAERVSVRVTSGSAAKQTARCVLAAYGVDGRLTATAVQTLSPGSTAELMLSGLTAGSTVKLFILNSTTGEPLRRSWSSALQAA